MVIPYIYKWLKDLRWSHYPIAFRSAQRRWLATAFTSASKVVYFMGNSEIWHMKGIWWDIYISSRKQRTGTVFPGLYRCCFPHMFQVSNCSIYRGGCYTWVGWGMSKNWLILQSILTPPNFHVIAILRPYKCTPKCKTDRYTRNIHILFSWYII